MAPVTALTIMHLQLRDVPLGKALGKVAALASRTTAGSVLVQSEGVAQGHVVAGGFPVEDPDGLGLGGCAVDGVDRNCLLELEQQVRWW